MCKTFRLRRCTPKQSKPNPTCNPPKKSKSNCSPNSPLIIFFCRVWGILFYWLPLPLFAHHRVTNRFTFEQRNRPWLKSLMTWMPMARQAPLKQESCMQMNAAMRMDLACHRFTSISRNPWCCRHCPLFSAAGTAALSLRIAWRLAGPFCRAYLMHSPVCKAGRWVCRCQGSHQCQFLSTFWIWWGGQPPVQPPEQTYRLFKPSLPWTHIQAQTYKLTEAENGVDIFLDAWAHGQPIQTLCLAKNLT